MAADDLDLIVVGLGRAGRAALDDARAAGLRVAGIDRRTGHTAVGLLPDADGWQVEIQAARGSEVLRARGVLLATGGYVQPREQRDVAGPRPSGIVTSDLVEGALASGLLPGRAAVVVGDGALARATAEALEGAGARVVGRLADGPLEVRGAARLEGVRTADGWLEADTLVFADRRQPQPFLLRALGLVDGRPGTPAPVDGEGRVGPPGLWAVGCCVDADVDHARCAAEGRRIAGIAIAALGRASA